MRAHMDVGRMVSVVLTLLLMIQPASLLAESFYDLKALNSAGSEVSLQEYRGKVSLVVNVASQCGYTDLNYRELVTLQEDFAHEGFTVLAFPCNQFGHQEPGTIAEITQFAQSYGINFPLFTKVDVMGQQRSEVYSFLFEATRTQPQWNFCKYLVDRDGSVRQFFSEKGDFAAIRHAIRYLLNKGHKEL